MIVVDTNVIAYSVLPGAQDELVRLLAVRDPAWVAPRLWRFELRNVLATTMRVRGLSLTDATFAFATAEELVQDAGVEVTTEDCLATAARGGVSAYDAEFVFAAERLGLPLVSADRRLVRAFPDRVVPLERFAAG